MGISGSLKDFTLPEILQIIDGGSKSGRLLINSSLKGKELQDKSTNYLWFQEGIFVAISNPFKYNNLLNLIKKENLLSAKNIVKLYSLEKELNTSLGSYCLENSLLNIDRVKQLFEKQLEMVYSLFQLDSGWFVFEDADGNNQILESKEKFPFMEMTGENREALAIALQGMRSLEKLDARLIEQMPEPNSGFIKLVNRVKYKLLPIEACIFDDANGQSSLKKIAQKTLFEISDLQEAALRLILIGLLEEVPIAGYSSHSYNSIQLDREIATSSAKTAVKTKAKKQVSNSMLGNLVSFLRNNF